MKQEYMSCSHVNLMKKIVNTPPIRDRDPNASIWIYFKELFTIRELAFSFSFFLCVGGRVIALQYLWFSVIYQQESALGTPMLFQNTHSYPFGCFSFYLKAREMIRYGYFIMKSEEKNMISYF